MRKLYIASGYNSWTNKQLLKAFETETETDQFLEGLTDPHIQVITYKSAVQLTNALLGNK